MMIENNSKKTVVVAMSGGVDSSVVAVILKKQGYNVVGFHIKSSNAETAIQDEKIVRDICEKFDIECKVVEQTNQMQIVVDYFKKEYQSGRTPNPCVVCNKVVKFSPFLEFAKSIGADYFATGHYARIEHKNGLHILKTAKDSEKDQTYFLNQLSQSMLEKALFPLGDLTKDQVRDFAKQNGLENSNKKDSYDICFLGNKKFSDFAKDIFPSKVGDIIDIKTNRVVGKHSGLDKYTIGQRKGLGIGGGFGVSGEAWFVVKKDLQTNKLYVSEGDGQELLSDALVSKSFNWIMQKPNETEFECFAKFRYRQKNQKVKVKINDDGTVFVQFQDKQRAITLGQFVVLYKQTDDVDVLDCIGGGSIDEVINF